MPTTINLRKLLHRKQWEMCNPCLANTGAGVFARYLDMLDYNISIGWACTAINTHMIYDAKEDSWQLLTGSASGGAFGAGACGRISPIGTSGTATAGTTSTITTNLTIPHDLRGYKIRITGGPSAAGQELTIVSNTLGANSVITVAAQAAAFTNATTFTLLTPTFWYFCPGTSAVGFNVYDWALGTWTTRSVTGLPTSFGTDGLLVSTEGIRSAPSETQAGKTFGSCTTTVLTLTGPTWTVNQWANSQLRVTGGTGAGQILKIASNTANTLTLATALTTALAADSTWVIEGSDDYLYLLGNNNVAMYRYSRSGNSWSTLAPGTVRAAAPGAGFSAVWPHNVNDAAWTNASAIKNGRYIYSMRGGGSGTLDIYDIALNTWSNAWAYGQLGEAFGTGSAFEYDGGDYIYVNVSGGQRFSRFNLVANRMEPLSMLSYPQSTAVVGDKLFVASYKDGGTTLKFLYALRNSGSELFRLMLY